jgi:hypothetical protein
LQQSPIVAHETIGIMGNLKLLNMLGIVSQDAAAATQQQRFAAQDFFQ